MTTLWFALTLVFLSAELPENGGSQVLVLKNEATLMGRVERTPTGFKLISPRGESHLEAAQVQKVCGSVREAYLYLQTRANLRDPHERLRLARWCGQHGLFVEARNEAEAAALLSPTSTEARAAVKLYSNQLEDLKRLPEPDARRAPEASASSQQRDEILATAMLEHWEQALTKNALREFTQRIQPILLNGCGRGACHGGSHTGTDFYLQVPPNVTAISPQITRANLARTLRWVDKKQPSASPLLKKALEPHGGSERSPLGGPDAPAYLTLEAWLKRLVPESAERLVAAPRPVTGPVTSFAGDRAEEMPVAPEPTSTPASEEPTAAEALEQLVRRSATPAAPPTPKVPIVPPPQTAEDLQRLSQSKIEGLLESGAAPMLGGGKVVNETNPAPRAGTVAPTSEPKLAPKSTPTSLPATANTDDPYDPGPFNEWARQQRRVRAAPQP